MPTADIHFPNVGLRVVSALIHFFGTAILAACLTRRAALEDLDTLRGWRTLSLARLTIILIFADSLLFLLLTGVLVHGVGLELSNVSCSLGIFSCIALYTSSKVLIYFFLSERVWIVWSNMGGVKSDTLAMVGMDIRPVGSSILSARLTAMSRRLKSPAYRFCMFSVGGYAVCFILLLVYRIARRQGPDGGCVIGLERQASIPLLSYDVYITCLLTAMFVWPLWSNRVMSHRLRRLAIRTLIASFVALATSTVNIAILTTLGGHELGWLCLASCGTDVMVNALVLDFVTESRLKRHIRHSRARLRVAQGGDLSASPDQSSEARRSQPVHLSGAKTTLDIGNPMTHSVELPIGGNLNPAASFEKPSPVVGETKVGEATLSPSVQGTSINDSVEARDEARLSLDEFDESKPGPSTSTSAFHLGTPAYQTAGHSSSLATRLHRHPSGKALTIDVDPQRHAHAHNEYDHGSDDQEAQLGGCDSCDCGSEDCSEDGISDEDDIAKTNQRPRLLSFTEALHELGDLRPPQPSPRVRTTARETVKAPRRLRWTPQWRQHQHQQLSPLKPMQGPPGAGYIGTSRRMSMPRTPDDIVLDDFYASTPVSPSSSAWGFSANHMGGLFGGGINRRPSQDHDQMPLGVLPPVPLSPTCALKGKGTARESSFGPIEPKASTLPGTVAGRPNGCSNTPMPEKSPRPQGLREHGTEETGDKREADEPRLPQWDNHVALLNRSSR